MIRNQKVQSSEVERFFVFSPGMASNQHADSYYNLEYSASMQDLAVN